MDEKTIALFCLCDDILKELRIRDDPQSKMTSAEIMTTALVSACLFSGNWNHARLYLCMRQFFPKMLSRSRLNRRLHAISPDIWKAVFLHLAEGFMSRNGLPEFIVDSFPVMVCHNSRLSRCKRFRGKEYHGYCASKGNYFFGIKVHMLTDLMGHPIEVLFTPGSESDIRAFRRFDLNIPEGSLIYGDRAYTDYAYEDALAEEAKIQLIAQRKHNSRRPMIGPKRYLQACRRKRIATTFSQITNRFPRSIAATTGKGFELKIFCFILVQSFEAALTAA
jgi:hypothetical protein